MMTLRACRQQSFHSAEKSLFRLQVNRRDVVNYSMLAWTVH